MRLIASSSVLAIAFILFPVLLSLNHNLNIVFLLQLSACATLGSGGIAPEASRCRPKRSRFHRNHRFYRPGYHPNSLADVMLRKHPQSMNEPLGLKPKHRHGPRFKPCITDSDHLLMPINCIEPNH